MKRTITSTNVTIQTVENGAVVSKNVVVEGKFETMRKLAAAMKKQGYEAGTYVLVNSETVKKSYEMDLATFIQYATPID